MYPNCGVVSSLFDAATGKYDPTPLYEHPFCAGHAFLANSTAIIMGGEELGAGRMWWLDEGRDGIRLFDVQNQWRTLGPRLPGYYWCKWMDTLLECDDQGG
jgi:hypothetical protein